MKLSLLPLAVSMMACSAVSPTGEGSPQRGETTDTPAPSDGRTSVFSTGAGGADPVAPSGGATTGGDDGADMGDGSNTNGVSCSDAAILACDDFEGHTDGAEPAAPWTVVKNPHGMTAAVVVVSSERAHSGNQSIKVDALGGYDQRALLAVPSVFPVANNHFFVRFWAYFENEFGSLNDGKHMSYALATGPYDLEGAHGEEVRPGVHGGILNINFKGSLLGDPSIWAYTDGDKHQMGIEPIVGEWVCTEIEFDGENHIINFWRNEEFIDELHVGAEEAAKMGLMENWSPNYADFRIGWQSYGGNAMVAYYDDVVLSTEKIGCAGP